jgi:hypothetical protein
MAVMLAVDLLAATQNLLLHDDLARAEPKTPRYRLLHNSPRGSPADNAASGCASNAPGPGLVTSPPRSHDSRHYPSQLVDLRSRHDEQRGYRQNQHAGRTTMPAITGHSNLRDPRSVRCVHE